MGNMALFAPSGYRTAAIFHFTGKAGHLVSTLGDGRMTTFVARRVIVRNTISPEDTLLNPLELPHASARGECFRLTVRTHEETL